MSLEGKGFFKIKLLIVTAIILIVVLISAVFSGIRALSSKQRSGKEESLSGNKKDLDPTEISSLGDTAPASNVLGNSYVVSDGTNIFLKNQYDNSKIYSYSDKGSLNLVSNNVPLHIYYYKDYIYYSAAVYNRSLSGSVGIYRSKVDGSEEKLLASFDTDTFYLVLDALVDGKLYFTLNKEAADGKDIYQMDLNTFDVQHLYTIPAAVATTFPLVNVTSDGLYFKDKEGLKKLYPESKEAELVIKDFDAVYYTIYKGDVYYTRSQKGGHTENVVRRVLLDGTKDELVYTGEASWIYDITAFVLNNKLFILSVSQPDSPASYGSIHSCELDGSKTEVISEKANLLGLTDDAIYYGFIDNSEVTKKSTEISKFEFTRTFSTYKRDVSAEGKVSDESVFLDPGPLNKAWASYKSLSKFYYPDVLGTYRMDYVYYDENGELYKNSWKNIDGKDYYFGEDGRMYSQEFTPDGYFVGSDGTVSDFMAPSKFVYSEYPDAEMTVNVDKYDESDKSNKASTIIDRGEVYEITNADILATSLFSEKEAVLPEAGQNFYFKRENLFCTVTGNEGYNKEFGGECIGLKQSILPNKELKLVKSEGSDKYILKVKDGKKVRPFTYVVYSGSVYVTKDAKLDVYHAHAPDEPPIKATFSRLVDFFTDVKGGVNGFYFNGKIVSHDTVKGTYAISWMSMFD